MGRGSKLHFLPALNLNPAAFAIAGMASVVGGATGAAMASIVMIFEMTLDYTVIVPITLTVGHQLCGANQPHQGQHLYAQINSTRGGSARNHARRPSSIASRLRCHATWVGPDAAKALLRRPLATAQRRHTSRCRVLLPCGTICSECVRMTLRSLSLRRGMDISPRLMSKE